MKHKIVSDAIKERIQLYEGIFDVVRIVDPIKKTIISCKEHDEIPDNATCYSLWLNNEMCENCITIKALKEKSTFTKIQHNGDKLFLMVAAPIEINGEIFALELLKDITNNMVFETVTQGEGHEVRNLTQDLNEILVKDALTDLYNRRYIDQMLPIEISKSIENKYPISVAMIDIDNFKGINDTYGHDFGDKVLKKFTQTLKKYIRDDVDWIARYGGDEFLVFLNNVDNKKAYKILERMRKAIEKIIMRIKGEKVQVTGSFGVYTNRDTEITASDLIKCADNNLYEAKNLGRNKVVF
ncbi:diguanylate cyclase [Clostridium chromiireducens]|uniref:Diguanylate cyclase n=1 Tax=Clostridium chromiireducens TaxID=225345 RepID=A0A964RSY9_9CLOT|nr:GGDEF domain-containing protein [Clostridium chromiireducens]MVX67246.1 diguanylate cyclase [Clostridium chromiireducens]